eukprot:14094637-Alexandrium_andersonii.AAC.1
MPKRTRTSSTRCKVPSKARREDTKDALETHAGPTDMAPTCTGKGDHACPWTELAACHVAASTCKCK